MAVLIGDYTNTDKVRGALGLTVHDVPDANIEARNLEDDLEIDLYGWLEEHETLYATWTDDAATAEQKHSARLLRRYCTYRVAFHLCSGLELLAVQAVGDSKATAERFSSVNLDALRRRVEAIAASARVDLEEVQGLESSSSYVSPLSIAAPGYDPAVGS